LVESEIEFLIKDNEEEKCPERYKLYEWDQRYRMQYNPKDHWNVLTVKLKEKPFASKSTFLVTNMRSC